MKKIFIEPRNNWQEAVEKIGFGFHSTSVPYWDESYYYQFEMSEINKIETATNELWELCKEAIQYVIDHNLYETFLIPEKFIPKIVDSWDRDFPSIYCRFDLGYNHNTGEIKLLEANADTPTALFEASIVQWYWLQDYDKTWDQFNSIHEKLVAYWAYLKNFLIPTGDLHFTCVRGSLEDLITTEYLRDCAIQGKIPTHLIFIDQIGWRELDKEFVDMQEVPIKNIFKLYPWEWLVRESFAEQLLQARPTYWIEPYWKMLLSNKAILPILWKLFPESPYILESHNVINKLSDPNYMANYVKKPVLSREGANIEIFQNNALTESTQGEYGDGPAIYQKYFEIPRFNNTTPVIGSWVIGQESVGIGIRESEGLITTNTSKFIPHLINEKFKG